MLVYQRVANFDQQDVADDGNSMVMIQTLRWVFEEREKMAIRYSHPELSTI